MAIANTTIQLRKSGVTGNVPSTLNLGELALNYADGRLYYKNSVGTITYISSGATSNSFATINANSSLVIATSNTDILSIAPGNNITVTANTTSKTITVGLSNNVTIPGTLTTGSGSGGYITGANIIYANTFVANTGPITFSDGTQQYTANAGGAGSSDTIARNIGSAAYIQANAAFVQANAAFVTANNAVANLGPIITVNSAGRLYVANTTTSALNVSGGALIGTNFANYLQVSGNTTGLNPYLSAQGSDANIGIRYDAKGTSLHAFGANGNTSFAVYTGPTSVDYFQMSGSNTGFPVMQAAGASANIGLTVLTKGTGGIFFKTGTGEQQAQISATTSAVNYLNFTGAIATRSPTISVAGTDTDISLNLTSKAAGTINLNGVDVVGALSSNASLQSGINTTQNTNITTANNAAWAAYAAGNTNATNITAVNTYAGSAYAQANATAGGLVTANTNITTANNAAWSAYAAGNTSAAAITIIQGVDTGQNTRMTIIEGVDTGQNTFMQAAFNKANTSIQTTGDQSITGNLTISKDLSVTGNLIVLGNTIAINTSSFTVVDSLITLGIGNYTTDVLDIGFAGHYNDGTNAHAGVIRDAGTKEWYLFKGYTPELNANNNVDINDASFRKANVNADYFKGNLIATTAYVNGMAVYENIQAAYGLANTHTNQITGIQGVDNTQNTRMTIIEGVDSTQNTNITTANNAAWAAYAAGNTNATNITAVNTYAGSAYAAANLALGIDATQNTLITTANTTATTGNNAAQAAFTLANTHTSQITIIQGVDVGQNTRMTIIEGVDTTQNSRMTIIEGVDTTQNTNITTANTRAYNSVLKTGDVMTGALNIAVTTAATSLTTGALIVGGGLSVSGNAYSTAVYTNGLYYAANGLPISTGSAGGGSSFGTVSVLGSQTANIVAVASNTLLTFSAGSGVTITPYSSNNTVSIGILGGAQGVQLDWGLITDTFSAVTFDFGPSLV